MNVLYIGPYRQGNDGWAGASRDYLESLLLTPHNISAKPIYMAHSRTESVSDAILKAEQNKLDKIDVTIQHVLPDLLEWHEGYNIGLIHTETNIGKHVWINKINLMDELWVGSPDEGHSLRESGVRCRINVLPVPVNTDVLDQYNEKMVYNELDNKFVFYFIGEHSERKNIMAFLRAFHREFSPEENVTILIKTNSEQIKNDINEWKERAKIREQYIPEILILGQIPEKEIYQIHQSGNCFVLTSYGEAQCRPMLDALYVGNTIIVPQNIFCTSLFDETNELEVVRVNSTLTPVDTKSPPLPHIYTNKETWYSINMLHLQKQMRHVFERQKEKVTSGKDYIQKHFSRKATAETICQLLKT